jgi:NTE family protein
MVQLGGHFWIDGGMVSSANAHLAGGYDEVLVIAPLPKGHGGAASVPHEVSRLRISGQAHLIVPDSASREAISPNIYDPARRAASADAGRAQGAAAAAQISW